MAIFHLSAKIVKRSEGRSAVRSAAYRSGSRLYDERVGMLFDYTRKLGVAYAEIRAPENAPSWVFDRERLWNTVEAGERRCDSQLAREIEVGLPIELSTPEQIKLAQDYVQREFVARGMIADFGVHLDNPHNPHAHILLTMRELTAEGFGRKNTSWNQTAALLGWRKGWAEVTNEHLAAAGLGIRVDHGSYRDQDLGLIPGRKLGVGLERQDDQRLPGFLADRVKEQRQIAAANGMQIIANPGIALKALTHSQATFTHHDVARLLHTRTDSAAQFQSAYLKVTTAPELVGLGVDEQGRQRFTTRDMLETERRLFADAAALAGRDGHGVARAVQAMAVARQRLSAEQSLAFRTMTEGGDLKVLVGVAGSGKSTALAAMRETWETAGYTVKGAALSGIASENLQLASGIGSRTLASYELAWARGRDPLSKNDVLVIDEAGMLGTRQVARVLEVARQAHAKVVLVGDPEQLQAIEAGAAFRGLAAQHGVAELNEVRRQRQEWQRTATTAFAGGKTTEALTAYAQEGGIVAVPGREDARNALLARWARDGQKEPQSSQLVLAYTRAEVEKLNRTLRTLRQQAGQLARSQEFVTERGRKEFAVNDRVRFLRNDRALGVKNGSLGTLEGIENGVMSIKLDGPSDTRVAVDTKFYGHLDHGYAATVHKAQGSTVDRTYVLATPHFDRHTTYVAMSRHRETATLFYAQEDFSGRGLATDDEVQTRLMTVLSRERAKDLAHDYLETGSGDAMTASMTREEGRVQAKTNLPIFGVERAEQSLGLELDRSSAEEVTPNPPAATDADSHRADHGRKETLEDIRQRAREAWRTMRENDPDRGLSMQQRSQRAFERWRAYVQEHSLKSEATKAAERAAEKERLRNKGYGMDDDLGM